MTLQYSPDITDWAHVVKVIEQEEKYWTRYREARRIVRERYKNKILSKK